MSSVSAPASTAEALAQLESAMDYLAAADPVAMGAGAQAAALLGLERLDAVQTAVRARLLGAFTAGKGYQQDGDYSPRSWLIHRAKITKGVAAGHLAWTRRAAAHPQVIAALAAGDVVSESHARTICGWTDKLPESCQQPADAILIAAAGAGADLAGLAQLAAEIYARSLPVTGEDEQGQDFEDRSVRVETTFGGMSGPGGLASFLRTRLLTGRLAGPSLPLDVGVSRQIPAAIRHAVILRAQGHCEWAGGCDQPAAGCEVHHLTHHADGGRTSVKNCALLCFHHHHVMIHRMGWTVTRNPDGTTTARSPDGTKVFHSHGPPARC